MKPPETGKAQYARKKASSKRLQRTFWFTPDDLELLFDLALATGMSQRDVLTHGLRKLEEILSEELGPRNEKGTP